MSQLIETLALVGSDIHARDTAEVSLVGARSSVAGLRSERHRIDAKNTELGRRLDRANDRLAGLQSKATVQKEGALQAVAAAESELAELTAEQETEERGLAAAQLRLAALQKKVRK